MAELGIIECLVCGQPMTKSRLHYGGVSCYSCRAFFRRNAGKMERSDCKESNQCVITFSDRKACASCRYRKCLSAGMIPQLVLTEEAKKQRFKKSIEKKKQNNKQQRGEEQEQELAHETNNTLDGRIKEEPEDLNVEKKPSELNPDLDYNLESERKPRMFPSSGQPNLPNFSSLNSVSQVLPIIRKISLSHISEFSKSLSEPNEDKKEMFVTEVDDKNSNPESWDGSYQQPAMLPTNPPVSVAEFQPGSSFPAPDSDRIQAAQRKRKSVICHTSQVKHFC